MKFSVSGNQVIQVEDNQHWKLEAKVERWAFFVSFSEPSSFNYCVYYRNMWDSTWNIQLYTIPESWGKC